MVLRRLFSALLKPWSPPKGRWSPKGVVRARTLRRFESLESRRMLSFDPSGFEQEMLEHINRMRMNPADELGVIFISTDANDPNYFVSHDEDVNTAINFFGVDDATLFSQWSSLTSVAPLAWNESLYDAATAHSERMILQDLQDHILPADPTLGLLEEDGLLDRAVAAGFDWSGSVTVAENVFAYTESVFHGHAAFAVDWGATPTGIQDPAGHRDNIMDGSFQEIGISVLTEQDPTTSVGPLVVTQDFASRGNYGNARILGVAFDDMNGDAFYDAGEGLGGLTVTITDGNTTYNTTTLTAGGYQVAVAAGTYDVTISGGNLSGPVYMGSVVVGADNVKLDFNADAPSVGSVAGVIFHDQDENQSLDPGESGLPGFTVYVDTNNNGVLDTGEQSTTSAADGSYSISNVTPGTNVLRLVEHEYFRGDSSLTLQVNQGGLHQGANFGQFEWVTNNNGVVSVIGTNAADAINYAAGANSFGFNGNSIFLGSVSSIAFAGGGQTDTLTLTGSAGSDTVTFQNGQLTMTGSGYTITSQAIESLVIGNGGLAGNDTAHLHGTAGDDTFTGTVSLGMLEGGGFSASVTGFDSVYAYGTGGQDVAHLYDGIGRDSFVAGSGYALLRNTGGGFYNYTSGFATVYGYATNGGFDTATVYDSQGDDTFTAHPTYATITDSQNTYFRRVEGFEGVYAFATAGGSDDARLYDGTTNDRFNGRPEFGLLRDSLGSFHNYAAGFARVFAYANQGGDDRAYLYDGSANDQFVGNPTYGLLRAQDDSFYNYAGSFDQVFAFGGAGGFDSANFYDSASNDTFVARPEYAYLEENAGGFYNYASSFDQVLAFSTAGGADDAYLFDSTGDDNLTGRPGYTVLWDDANTFYNYASGFNRTFGYAENGGYDVAHLYDDVTDDSFVAGPDFGLLRSTTGEFYNYTTGFDEVTGHSTAGGTDYATLYDSASDDTFTAFSSYAMMQDLAGTYALRANGFAGVFGYASTGNDVAELYDSSASDTAYGRSDYMILSSDTFRNRATGFDTVRLHSSQGGTDTLDALSLLYVLETTGTWN